MLMASPDEVVKLKPTAAPEGHPALPTGKTGVLLLNLGTPDATTYWPMRRYLSEFLSDKRVIDYPAWLWQPLLQGVILSTRPKRSGRAYASIWNKELDESPLRTITRSQSQKLAARLEAKHPGLVVDWAMRYGNPSTASVLERMQKTGCTRVLMFALYPQYSATTTATAYDKAFDALKKMTWQPAIRTAPPYFDDARYIDALKRSVEAHLAQLDFTPEVLVTSFHGLPERYHVKLGDPYHCHCAKTNRLLAEALGWPRDKVILTFQSRFGPEKWLQPYTDETVQGLAESGVKSMAIMAPAFSADCVETLEELCDEVKESFTEHGGENFTYIPCLNDTDDGMDVIERVVLRELQGWI